MSIRLAIPNHPVVHFLECMYIIQSRFLIDIYSNPFAPEPDCGSDFSLSTLAVSLQIPDHIGAHVIEQAHQFTGRFFPVAPRIVSSHDTKIADV